MPPRRNIIHKPEFDAALFNLHHTAPRCDEFVHGITEILHIDPTRGKRIGSTDIWCFSTPDIPEFLALVVYYTFNDDTVWLLWIDTP